MHKKRGRVYGWREKLASQDGTHRKDTANAQTKVSKERLSRQVGNAHREGPHSREDRPEVRGHGEYHISQRKPQWR